MAIAAVLAGYDEVLICEATDPRTGISTTEKFRAFPPNSGELKAWLDDRAAHRRRMQQYAAMPKPDMMRLMLPPRGPGHRARLLVPFGAPGYQAMLERSQRPDADPLDWRHDPAGIRVALTWWDDLRGPPGGFGRPHAPSDAELRARYGTREAAE